MNRSPEMSREMGRDGATVEGSAGPAQPGASRGVSAGRAANSARRGGLRAWLLHPAAKPFFFALCLLPLAGLVWGAVAGQLGANPAETLVRSTGDWSLRFLCITLAVTPLRVLTATPALARFRRMLGLFMYFYVVCHLLSYGWFDMGFYLDDIARDIAKRPFILVGFSAFVLLTPLAATSFNRAIKMLGARRWQRLHRLVYAVAGLAILHFFWMRAGKNNFAEVSVYAAILGVLLGWRAVHAWRTRRAAKTHGPV